MRAPVWITALVALTLASACRSKKPEFPRVEQAHRAVVAAARTGDAAAVFELLDRSSAWSLMSTLRANQRIHSLVEQHYPTDRRARALRRTAAAARCRDARDYFVHLARRDGLLAQLAGAAKIDAIEGDRDKEAVVRSGDRRLSYCRGDQGWRFCGWRGRFERLKVRAARDLLTVRENAETFQRGR